jgi:hypothetical protein
LVTSTGTQGLGLSLSSTFIQARLQRQYTCSGIHASISASTYDTQPLVHSNVITGSGGDMLLLNLTPSCPRALWKGSGHRSPRVDDVTPSKSTAQLTLLTVLTAGSPDVQLRVSNAAIFEVLRLYVVKPCGRSVLVSYERCSVCLNPAGGLEHYPDE